MSTSSSSSSSSSASAGGPQAQDRWEIGYYRFMLSLVPGLAADCDLQDSDDAGKFMVAKRDIPEGHAVLEEAPLFAWKNEDAAQYGYPALPWAAWNKWQTETSGTKTAVGVIALARALCYIAEQYKVYKAMGEGEMLNEWEPGSTLTQALQNVSALCGLDEKNAHVEFYKTSIEEIQHQLVSLGRDKAPLKDLPDTCFETRFLQSIAGKISQNAIALPLADGSNTKAVFLLLSLLNHDCDPNVEVSIVDEAEEEDKKSKLADDEKGTDEEKQVVIMLKARRPIKEGEKLTITYCGINAELKERKKLLQNWAFDCRCSKCVLEELLEAQRGENGETVEDETEDERLKRLGKAFMKVGKQEKVEEETAEESVDSSVTPPSAKKQRVD